MIGKISYGRLFAAITTTVHNCDNEEEVIRIQEDYPNTEFSERGYIVIRPKGSVEYHLAMTRALGHKQLMIYGIIPDPTITVEELTDRHLFLILASDGIWDSMDPDSAVEFVEDSLQTMTAQEVAESLVDKALDLADEDDKDNATAVVVILQPPLKFDTDQLEESEKEEESEESEESEEEEEEESSD